jgi:DNA repair exonuclease SbcCD ATPase subunit
VISLSENVKLRFDLPSGQNRPATPDPLQPATGAAADDSGQAAEAESQMRKALGLLGENSRHRQDPMDQPGRGPDRFNGGLHRRRFVQDGDVPVTVLRREPSHEIPANRAAAAVTAPSSSRLQRTEAALAAETAARDRAERALAEAQAATRDLQTKIGHAELAKTEAIDALRREHSTIAGLRAEVEALEGRSREAEVRAQAAEEALNEQQILLSDERQARRALEKNLRAAENAREAADQLIRDLTEQAATVTKTARRRAAVEEPEIVAPVAPAKRGRPAAVVIETETDPEPVKWWLNAKPASKRR